MSQRIKEHLLTFSKISVEQADPEDHEIERWSINSVVVDPWQSNQKSQLEENN